MLRACVCAQSLEARIRECEDQVGPVLARQRVLVGLRSFVTLRVAVSTSMFVFDCSPSQACYPGVDAAPAPNHRVQHHQQRVLTRIHGLHTDVDWQCGGCTQSALCVGGAADRGLTKCCLGGASQLPSEPWVMVRSSDPRQPPATWTLAKFTNRLCYARDLHHVRDTRPQRFCGHYPALTN